MSLGEVLVIYTGGTIGMIHRDKRNRASPLIPVPDGKALAESVPQLEELKSEVPYEVEGLCDEGGDPMEPLDSSDINLTHWGAMASHIGRRYDDYDGFVILHGTDTMAYTSSALSFMLGNLAKPVIVTGSQLPMTQFRTDAVQNFVNAVMIAGYRHTDQPLVPEVAVCFADRLLRGNRVRKVSTRSWQGFDTPNYPVLGEIGEHLRIFRERLRPPAEEPFYALRTKFDERVLDFGLFPGLNPKALENILKMEDVQGMVLRTFGAGNAPNSAEFLDVLGRAVERDDKVIVNVTPCTEGEVEAGLYEASSGLLERGVISGLDMTPESALTKLMWLLGSEPDRDEIRSQMQVGQRGEQTESLVEVRYSARKAVRQDGGVVVGGRPQGVFRRADLSRAVLRAAGLRSGEGEDTRIGVYINFTGTPKPLNEEDSERAGILTANSPQCFVTPMVRRVAEEGRPINVMLVAEDGAAVEFDSMSLALFTRS